MVQILGLIKNRLLIVSISLQADAQGVKLDLEVVRPKIPFSSLLETFRNVEVVDDFFSTAAQTKTTAIKTVRLKTFPDYLFVQVSVERLLNASA